MPKLIDYPRTTYAGAWELAEVVDDTGGKCAIDTAARKLNRKVSGSFKAIIGSAVKFGLMTSKRELLTTTTLFKRIKHAYDKQEELLFHREAFLTPPLFIQLCRKFRSRELPVQMLDVMLIREFGVEEINAQGVAKAFVEGCRMVGLLDERNMVADVDSLASQQAPRRELASPRPSLNAFRTEAGSSTSSSDNEDPPYLDNGGRKDSSSQVPSFAQDSNRPLVRPAASTDSLSGAPDAIASLFGFAPAPLPAPVTANIPSEIPAPALNGQMPPAPDAEALLPSYASPLTPQVASSVATSPTYQIQISGPGVNTSLSITEEEDIGLAVALLEKIRRQLKA